MAATPSDTSATAAARTLSDNSTPATPIVAHTAAVRSGTSDQVTPAGGWKYEGYYYWHSDCVSQGEYLVNTKVGTRAVTYQCPPAYDWFWGWGYGLYAYYN
jgi:hypothetical protein